MALNSILGVAAESINAAAEVMLLPSLILAFFVAELTPSYATIGLVPAIAIGFWTLGRLPAHLLSPVAPAAATMGLCLGGRSRGSDRGLGHCYQPHGPADRSLSRRDRLILTVFLCLIAFSLAGGFGSLAGGALLQSSIATRNLGSLCQKTRRVERTAVHPGGRRRCAIAWQPARCHSQAATDGCFSWPPSVWSSSPS